MTTPTLTYFPARGRAELIRFVLSEAGVAWQEHPVGKDTPPRNGRPTDFAALKASGLLPFGAVPLWEEDGLVLAQSQAIALHLARTRDLYGETDREHALVDQLLGAYDDLRLETRKLVTTPAEGRAAVRKELLESTLPRWLGYLDKLLKQNHGGAGFFVGERITVADLAVFVLLEGLRDNKFGAATDGHPALAAFEARIAARPRIAAYLASATRHKFVPLPS
jgi:glutathione S-transferase